MAGLFASRLSHQLPFYGTSSSPRSHCGGCFHSFTQDSTQNSSGQSNGFGCSTSMAWPVMAPNPVGDANLLSSKAANVKDNDAPSVRKTTVHPLWKTLALIVWPLSGEEWRLKDFQKKCARCSWHRGETVPQRDMQYRGRFGLAGVLNGRSVPS